MNTYTFTKRQPSRKLSSCGKSLAIISSFILFICGCTQKGGSYDASGTFSAREVTVSAQQSGQILSLGVERGDTLSAGQKVGLIDTVQLYLQALSLGVSSESYSQRRPEVGVQIGSLRESLAAAKKDLSRYEALLRDGAVSQKQRDDAALRVSTLQSELDARVSSLGKESVALGSQASATDIQRRQVLDLLDKCHICSPVSGTVIGKYAEDGEFASPGKPLFKVADLSKMTLTAYFTSERLSDLSLGQEVSVTLDYGGGKTRDYKGKVEWISPKAEFTPKTILTSSERGDLVYAVRIAVPNDGGIKIGMYATVKL